MSLQAPDQFPGKVGMAVERDPTGTGQILIRKRLNSKTEAMSTSGGLRGANGPCSVKHPAFGQEGPREREGAGAHALHGLPVQHVPSASLTIGTTLVCSVHRRGISVARSQYFAIFSSSFSLSLASPGIATSIIQAF